MDVIEFDSYSVTIDGERYYKETTVTAFDRNDLHIGFKTEVEQISWNELNKLVDVELERVSITGSVEVDEVD